MQRCSIHNECSLPISKDFIKRELFDMFIRQTCSEGIKFEPWRTDHISRASQYSDFLSELAHIAYPEIAKSFISDVYDDITYGDDDLISNNNINDLIYSIIATPWIVCYPDYYGLSSWTENRMGHYTCADYIRDMEIKRKNSSDIEHLDRYQFIPYNSGFRRPTTVKFYDTLTSDSSSENFYLKQSKTESEYNNSGRRLSARW